MNASSRRADSTNSTAAARIVKLSPGRSRRPGRGSRPPRAVLDRGSTEAAKYGLVLDLFGAKPALHEVSCPSRVPRPCPAHPGAPARPYPGGTRAANGGLEASKLMGRIPPF